MTLQAYISKIHQDIDMKIERHMNFMRLLINSEIITFDRRVHAVLKNDFGKSFYVTFFGKIHFN